MSGSSHPPCDLPPTPPPHPNTVAYNPKLPHSLEWNKAVCNPHVRQPVSCNSYPPCDSPPPTQPKTTTPSWMKQTSLPSPCPSPWHRQLLKLRNGEGAWPSFMTSPRRAAHGRLPRATRNPRWGTLGPSVWDGAAAGKTRRRKTGWARSPATHFSRPGNFRTPFCPLPPAASNQPVLWCWGTATRRWRNFAAGAWRSRPRLLRQEWYPPPSWCGTVFLSGNPCIESSRRPGRSSSLWTACPSKSGFLLSRTSSPHIGRKCQPEWSLSVLQQIPPAYFACYSLRRTMPPFWTCPLPRKRSPDEESERMAWQNRHTQSRSQNPAGTSLSSWTGDAIPAWRRCRYQNEKDSPQKNRPRSGQGCPGAGPGVRNGGSRWPRCPPPPSALRPASACRGSRKRQRRAGLTWGCTSRGRSAWGSPSWGMWSGCCWLHRARLHPAPPLPPWGSAPSAGALPSPAAGRWAGCRRTSARWASLCPPLLRSPAQSCDCSTFVWKTKRDLSVSDLKDMRSMNDSKDNLEVSQLFERQEVSQLLER